MSEDDLRLFVALRFDHDAHAVAVAFVADISDAFDFFVLNKLGNVLDEAGIVLLIWMLGDVDVVAIFSALFVRSFRAHLEAAAAVIVGLFDSLPAVDERRRWKSPGTSFITFFRFTSGSSISRIAASIVSFRLCGGMLVAMPTAMPDEAIDEQARNSGWQDGRFLLAFVEVRYEVDGFFLDVREHFFRDF